MSKPRVVAAVVRLLDKACIRIGNRQYLEANDSRGATTLTSEHVCTHSHDYIHSAILSFAEEGSLGLIMRKLQAEKRRLAGLTTNEARLVLFLMHAENETMTELTAKVPSRKKAA